MEAARAAEAESIDTHTSEAAAEPEQAEEPAAEEQTDPGEPTLQDAVDRASELIGNDRSTDVKAALVKIGKRRVGELSNADEIRQFLANLSS